MSALAACALCGHLSAQSQLCFRRGSRPKPWDLITPRNPAALYCLFRTWVPLYYDIQGDSLYRETADSGREVWTCAQGSRIVGMLVQGGQGTWDASHAAVTQIQVSFSSCFP